MTVKIIPITPEYREGWDATFRNKQLCQCEACLRDSKQGFVHWSDCAVHNEPAMPNGPCDCGGAKITTTVWAENG